MEAIILIGIQGTGKSTFYHRQFSRTHLRINLDMLRTRNREMVLMQTCLQITQPFVIDNTSPARQDRERYIIPARAAGFRVVGYYFRSVLEEALQRNSQRTGKERIPVAGVRGTYSRLQLPQPDEGFDALYYVYIDQQGEFIIREWHHEV
jgi:predicted kinase